jgi:molybdenum cofactor cytidylyltransferase
MKVHGTAPGSIVDASSEMLLADGPAGTTRLSWSADVVVSGNLASLAARVMGGVAQRLTDRFFDSVRRRIEELSFRFGPVALDRAEGMILGHNMAGPDGRRLLRKGRPLSAADVAALRALGRTVVYVASPAADDVDEDAAAIRIAAAAMGPGLTLSGPASGRSNIVATALGVFRVDPARLAAVNSADGLTMATLRGDRAVRPGQLVATVKVVPFAVPASAVADVEAAARDGGPLLRVDPIEPRRAALILSGSPSIQERVRAEFEPPLRARIEALGSALDGVDFVALEDDAGEEALAGTLKRRLAAGVGLVVLAGETAIVDRRDIAPRAIEKAGGEVACFGVPVDPGNLLLLAYVGTVPVLGAPGCARSRNTNVVDWVLPRLLAGERLSRADLVGLGHGGLLDDVPERPVPRRLGGGAEDAEDGAY